MPPCASCGGLLCSWQLFSKSGTLAELGLLYQVGLFPREVRIAADWGVEVASEDILKLARNHHLLGRNCWELYPVFREVCRHPINFLVNSFPSGFDVSRRLFAFRVSCTFCCFLCRPFAFCHVIVFLLAIYFTPEPQLLDVFGYCESFQGFENLIADFLPEPNPSHLEPFALLYNVREVPYDTNLLRLLILFSSAFVGFLSNVWLTLSSFVICSR